MPFFRFDAAAIVIFALPLISLRQLPFFAAAAITIFFAYAIFCRHFRHATLAGYMLLHVEAPYRPYVLRAA